MSVAEPDRPEDGEEDLRAAELVLGVLPGDEMAALARRAETDPGFAALVRGWEDRLYPMADGFVEAAPAARVKQALDARLFAAEGRAGWWQSLFLWRSLAGAAALAVLVVIAAPLLSPDPEGAGDRFAAALAPTESDVSYLALYDPGRGALGLSHVSGEVAADRDLQLWLIRGEDPPLPVGVIPAGARVEIVLAPEINALVGAGGLLAISVEPLGGSPTGLPTGPVVAAGDLRAI